MVRPRILVRGEGHDEVDKHMHPMHNDLWGTLDLGGRSVPLYMVDEFALAAGEAPRSVYVTCACAACGFVHQHTTEIVYQSHDHDRAIAYEITYVASIAAPCARCSTPMHLDIVLDMSGQYLQPGIRLSLYTASARNTRPVPSPQGADGH